MNKATAKQMKVRWYGVNKHGDYYKVNETHNVTYNVQGEPFSCIDCPSNTCDHCEAVKDHLQENGIAE